MIRLAIFLISGFCLAQTRINLSQQSMGADLSAMRHTRPVQVGTALPATCLVGELFFKTTDSSGQNLYGCVATNLWMLMSGNSSSGSPADIALVQRTSDTVITVPAGGAGLVFRCGNRSTTITSAATITLGAGSAAPSSTAWLYFDCSSHGLMVDTSSAMNQQNISVLNLAKGAAESNGFPGNAIPIATLTAGNNSLDQWDAAPLTDWRAAGGSTSIAQTGPNLTETLNADGSRTIGYDPTTGLTPTGPFDASGASQFRIRNVSSDPAACSVGEKIFNTTSATEKTCTAANTWAVAGAGLAVAAAPPYLMIGSTPYLAPSMFAAAAPDAKPWTPLNGTGMVTTTVNHSIAIQVSNTNGVQVRGLTTPKTAAPATLTVAVNIQLENAANVVQNVSPMCGVGYTDGVGVYGVFLRTGQAAPDVEIVSGGWAALTGAAFTGYRSTATGILGRVFIKIVNTSSNNYTYSWSLDGLTWTDIESAQEWNVVPDRWFAGCTNNQGVMTDSGPVSITLLHTDIR